MITPKTLGTPLSESVGTTTTTARGDRWLEIAVAVAIIATFFAFLSSRGLNEPDEGRYAELGREMLVGGDWLIPRLNGIEHFQKPPLIYWATAASLGAFGINEWAARLPSTLAALSVIALTAWMGGVLFGRKTGVATALVLASSGLFFTLARILTPDMLLTFWITSAIACLVQVLRGRGVQWRWLFFTAMGFGFLTKGPMALVVPISAAVGMCFAARRNGCALRLPWARGLLITLAIGLSWFIAVSFQHPELARYFSGDELLNRFFSKAHGRSRPFWFFIPTLLVGFLPWAFFLPALGIDAWRRIRGNAALAPVHGLLLGWVIPPFLILSFSGSKLPTYILPLFPALVLAMTAWWQWKQYSVRTIMFLASAMLMLGVGASSQVHRFNDRFAQQASVRPLVALLRAQPDLYSASIFACEVRAHGWEFYLGTCVSVTRDQAEVILPTSPAQKERLFDSVEECERTMAQRPVAYGLVRANAFGSRFPPTRWRVIGKAGDFLLIGRTPP